MIAGGQCHLHRADRHHPGPRPETEIVDGLAVSEFMTVLNPLDREVVVLRNSTTNLTEIAAIMGYSNHSAVSKQLKRIRDLADRFFEDN